MNVLLLSATLPYPTTSGGALRVFSLIRALQRLGHTVELLCFSDGTVGWKDTPLATLCSDVVTVLPPQRSRVSRLKTLVFSKEADVANRLASEAMTSALKEKLAAKRFDLVQAEGIEMAWLLPVAKEVQPTAKLCFDTFNAEYLLQRVIARIDSGELRRWPMAIYSWLQANRIARYEREVGLLADIMLAVSPEDAAALGSLLPGKSIPVVPSSISVADYSSRERKPLGAHALVFTGKMDYRPNIDAAIWFTKSILPRIQQQIPDTTLYIVGQQPHSRLDELRSTKSVEITGYVPTVVPYLRGAAVYVAPLRMGSGTRLKLLEAMATGCAIVATPTAAAGLLKDATAAMRIAANEERFAQEVVSLLNDVSSRRILGEQACAAAAAFYDWTAIADRLRRVYEEAGLG